MLKSRIRRRTAAGEGAIVRLAAIEASITALGDEDLLDLADIFVRGEPTPLQALASAEMAKRGLRL